MTERRRVGPLGEKVFCTWASEENAILNKAYDDRGGWDFILEFPVQHPFAVDIPDKKEEAYQCFIQIKSTDSPKQSRSVKMSNWKRLVETPLPAFFLVLRFDRKRTCQRAFLVHVWEEEIARVLRRARELGVKGEGDRLHKYSLSLTWHTQDRLRKLTGKSLLTKIAKTVGPSPAAYSEKKLRLRKSVGYDTANAQLTTRIVIPPEYRERHPDELLVDSILDLVPPLELAGGEIRDVRFGIPSSPIAEIPRGAKLKLGPGKAVASANLILRPRDRSKEVSLPVTVLSPGGIQRGLAPSAQKVLLRLPYAEFILPVHGTTGTIHFKLPNWDELVPLSKAAALACLLRFITEERDASAEPVDIWLDDHQIGTVSLSQFNLPKEAQVWADLVLLARDVAVQMSLPPDMKTTCKSLLAQRNALTAIRAASENCGEQNLAFTFSLKKGSPPKKGEQMCFPIHLEIELGGKRMVVFESMIGIPKDERTKTGEYVVPIHRAEIETVLRLAPGEPLPRKREDYLNEIAQARAQEGGVLCWWQSTEAFKC
jgi:hypothetical protein